MTLSVAESTAAAREALPAIASTTLGERASILRGLGEALDTNRDELVAIAERETGLSTERLVGEVARTSGQLRLFASVVEEGSWLEAVIDHADAGLTPPRPDLRRMLVPLGPVAMYSASNFPFAFSVLGGDTASALAAGCPVIVKAHSGHPELSVRTAEIARAALESAGMTPSALTLVAGREAGRELIQHPVVRAGAFTGSLGAGRILYDLAGARPDPIPFYGELGSVNPVVVGESSTPERNARIATGLVNSFTLGQGQFCTKPGIVMIPAGSDLPELVRAALVQRGGRMLTSSIAEAFDLGVTNAAGLPGVRVVAQGEAGADGPAVPGQPPTVFLTDVATAVASREVLLEECFGPTTLLVEYETVEQLTSLVDVLPAALTASVHLEPRDLERFEPVLAALRDRAGRVVFDGWPTGVAVTWSQQHGGPWPATTNALFTSVGATASRRFLRPIAYQDAPAAALPPALRDDNPWGIPRRIDGQLVLAEAPKRG